jgi:ABC-2 type transport system permease protein
MKNIFIIASREYADNARTKGFWINLLMFPVILWGSIKVPQLLEEKAIPTRNYILIDQGANLESVVSSAVERTYAKSLFESLTKYFSENAKESSREEINLEKIPALNFEEIIEQNMESNPAFVEQALQPGAIDLAINLMRSNLKEDAPEFEYPKRPFSRIELPSSIISKDEISTISSKDIVERLRPYLLGDSFVEGKELFALIIIPPLADKQISRSAMSDLTGGSDEMLGVQYWAKNLADSDLPNAISRALNDHVRTQEYQRLGVDEKVVAQVRATDLAFTSFDPSKEAGEEKVSLADTVRQFAPIGFVYLMWVAIFTVVNMLLNNTIEEKSNRIIEVLLSSATPWEIMTGKLIGIAGVGLTMMTAWVVSMIGLLKFMAGPEVEWASTVLRVIQDSGLLPLFGIYFVCGYLTYAGLFLAIGALCSTIKEAQNFMGTATVVLMVPLFTMVFIARDPNGALAEVLTWIPLYTPFVMMNRAAADPPAFDLYGSGVLMLLTIFFMLWVSGRIFRIGILRTGQPPKLFEIFKSLTTSLRNQ